MTDSYDELLGALASLEDHADPGSTTVGDRRDGRVYLVTEELLVAAQVAIVTGRPLLLTGPPGCGKSSFAAYLARNLGLDYLDHTVTEQSRPRDLLWTVDAVRRLSDAQLGKVKQASKRRSMHRYVEPGPLWWALDPRSAERRGAPDGVEVVPATRPPGLSDHVPTRPGSVLLIDEIDKADSEFTNGLLVALGSLQFTVTDLPCAVEADPGRTPGTPLIIVTTNAERSLPGAFVRRCIVAEVEQPGSERLLAIAMRHYGLEIERAQLADRIAQLSDRIGADDGAGTSTAEFLDLVRVLLHLGPELVEDQWELLDRILVSKRTTSDRLDAPGW